MTDDELMTAAKRASASSYSPYSNFRVGAALLCDDGEVFTACNVENSSYGAACCAERNAVFAAAARGKRRFSKIAVAGTSDGSFSKLTQPCGICRQVLSEFCTGDFEVLLSDSDGLHILTLSQLLPYPFEKSSM